MTVGITPAIFLTGLACDKSPDKWQEHPDKYPLLQNSEIM